MSKKTRIPKSWEMQKHKRMMPRREIYLATWRNCDSRYVRDVFEATWKKIPLSGRRRILQQIRRNGCLEVEVLPLSHNQGECRFQGSQIRLDQMIVNFWAERQLMFVVAHELGHVVDEGTMHDWAVSELPADAAPSDIYGRIMDRKKQEPVDVLEKRVDRLVATWGFRPSPKGIYLPTSSDRPRIDRNHQILSMLGTRA